MINRSKIFNLFFLILSGPMYFGYVLAHNAIDDESLIKKALSKIYTINDEGPVLYTKHQSKPKVTFDNRINEKKDHAGIFWGDQPGFCVRVETMPGQPEYDGFLWACQDAAKNICRSEELRKKWQEALIKIHSQNFIDKFFEQCAEWAESSEAIERDFVVEDPEGKKITYNTIIFLENFFVIQKSESKSTNRFIDSDELIKCKGHFTQIHSIDSGKSPGRAGRLLFVKCFGQDLEWLRELMVDQKAEVDNAILRDKQGKEFVLLKIRLSHNFALDLIEDIEERITKKFGIEN